MSYALINDIIYVMDKKEFMQKVSLHKGPHYTNSYFIQYNEFNSKLSSVAIVLTSDNFVAVGERSLSFALTHISSQLSKSYYDFRKKKISYHELKDTFIDMIKHFEKITPSDYEIVQDNIRLKKLFPHISYCFKLFGKPVFNTRRRCNDLVLFGGHPNKNEEMTTTVMREVSEESNIQNCSELHAIGTLTIYDHRFEQCFSCNLFLYRTEDTKEMIKNNFKQNGEISNINFTMLRKKTAKPLEIIQHCLE